MERLPSARPRVVSLLPAATEIVAELGLGDLLVGVSHECDFPPSVRELPRVSRARVATDGSSRAIHERVAESALAALGVFEVDRVRLAELAPDIVLTQDLCDVCAVPLAAVERALGELGLGATRIVSLKPMRLDDVWHDFLRVADALGAPERGTATVARLTARIDALAARARRIPWRPRVLTIEWLDPVMIGGTWMPELVELAGGEPLVTRAGDRAPTLDLDALRALDPEVVLIKPCGFDLARSLAEYARIKELVGSVHWPAAIRGEMFLCDGNAYFNRPGPRLVESLEIVAACLHPTRFADFAAQHGGSLMRIAERARAR